MEEQKEKLGLLPKEGDSSSKKNDPHTEAKLKQDTSITLNTPGKSEVEKKRQKKREMLKMLPKPRTKFRVYQGIQDTVLMPPGRDLYKGGEWVDIKQDLINNFKEQVKQQKME